MNLQQLKEEHPALHEKLLTQAKQELLAQTADDAGRVKAGSETTADLSTSDQFSSMSASVLAKRAENERGRLSAMAKPNSPATEDCPQSSPAERIRAVRRLIARDYWFLNNHLKTLEGLMKSVEKRGYHPSERVIEELKGLMITRGAAIFRGMGEVRQAVADHLAVSDEGK